MVYLFPPTVAVCTQVFNDLFCGNFMTTSIVKIGVNVIVVSPSALLSAIIRRQERQQQRFECSVSAHAATLPPSFRKINHCVYFACVCCIFVQLVENVV